MVFDRVVSSSLENIGYVGPFVSSISVDDVEDPFFLPGPSSLSFDHRVQMIVPSFSALLADSSWKMVCNDCPPLRTIDVYQVEKKPILDICPWTLYKAWIQNFLPSVETLNICSSF